MEEMQETENNIEQENVEQENLPQETVQPAPQEPAKEEDEQEEQQQPHTKHPRPVVATIDHRLLAGKLNVHDWLGDLPKTDSVPEIVEVRFKNTRKGFYTNPSKLPLQEGDIVAVEAALGHDIGVVSLAGELVKEQMRLKRADAEKGGLKKVYRKAKPHDIEKWKQAIALEYETMIRSRKIAADLHLNMKIGDVEYQGDKTKAIFYYIADDPTPHPLDPRLVLENSHPFRADWEGGQKTGFFLDQRDNRALVGHYARGRRVLNTFCYTGGFSVYALRGGALSVDSVDSSEKAIRLCTENSALSTPAVPHRELVADALAYVRQMPPDAYDLVILDPPAFAKHQKALPNALQGYKRLNAAALEKMPAGSLLFTFSCSQAVSREQFRLAVFSAAAQARRRVRILHQLTQPADHPVNIYHPEGEYLKGLVLYVE